MLSEQDLKWLNKLPKSKKAKIVPYNPKVKEVFEKQKKEILEILGQDIEILHLGATGVGISGQGEIDLVIPVPLDRFDELIEKLKKKFGKPKSFSPNNRIRFNHQYEDIDIEIILVNKYSEGWKRNMAFEKYLKSHPEALNAYKILKESNNGESIRKYYQKKIEFINDILNKALR